MVAISATVELSAGAGSIPRVRLDVTGAPAGPAANYASNFATVDGWTAGANGAVSVAGGVATFTATGPPTAVFSRTVTGLTIGTVYAFTVLVDPLAAGAQVQLGESVTGGVTAWTTPAGVSPYGTYYALSYTWTATATSHTIQVRTRPSTNGAYTQAFNVKDARVAPASWVGTSITRTDANGTNVPVRSSGNVGATSYTVHDYEAALLGELVYTVTDGNGVTASSSPTSHAAWLTNLVTNPSAEAGGAGVERRRNQFTNPSASVNTANVGAGYGTGGAGTFTRQAGGSPSGLGTYFRQAWTTAPSAAASIFVANSGGAARFAVAPGDVWSASVAFRTSLTSSHKLGIVFADAGFVQIGGANYGADVAAPAGQWVTLSSSGVTAPAGAAYAYLIAVPATGAALPIVGTTHDYTLFTAVKEAVAGAGFDGDTVGAAGLTYAWTGAAGASSSTVTGATATGYGVGLSSTLLTRDSTLVRAGAYALRADWTAGVALSGAALFTVPTVAGNVYTVGAWVYAPAGSPDVALTAYFVSGGPSTATKDAWVWLTHTFTATASSTAVGITNATAAGAGARAYLDGLVAVAGDRLPSYFDGSSDPDAPLSSSYWTGAADASTSVLTGPKASPGVWLTLPATYVAGVSPPVNVAVLAVTTYDEDRESGGSLHRIINRPDPIANPGPLSDRSGTMTIWCDSYAAAKRIGDVLAAGDVGLVRQPDFPGLDVYFTPRRVSVRTAGARLRWTVQLAYEEVAAP
jgi:hypothetical protein